MSYYKLLMLVFAVLFIVLANIGLANGNFGAAITGAVIAVAFTILSK